MKTFPLYIKFHFPLYTIVSNILPKAEWVIDVAVVSFRGTGMESLNVIFFFYYRRLLDFKTL